MAKLDEAVLEKNRQDAADAWLDSDKPFAGSDFAGRLINTGYIGVISKITMVPLPIGGNITGRDPKLGDQKIGDKVVGNAGDPSAVLSLVMDDGRTIALSTLTNHPASTINNAAANKMGGKEFKDLIGKTFTCVERYVDEDRPNNRTITNASGQREQRNGYLQKYTVTVA